MEISPDDCSHQALAQQPAAAAHQLKVIDVVKSVVLSWEKGRNPVVRVVVVKLLVRWVLVRGKVLVVMDLLVVVLRKVVGPVYVACL